MSTILLNQALAFVRGRFTPAEVKDVRTYGGEFSAGEVGQVSYSSPAIFIAVLGWRPEANSRRLTGRNVRSVRMAAFVAVKHPNRDKRMQGAMDLADKMAIGLRAWRPDSTGLPLEIAALEDEAACENLYGRAIDATGQALWLVDWTQCVKPTVPLEQLYDLIAIDITDRTVQGTVVPAAPAPAAPLTVTEDVQFKPLT